MLYIWHFFFSDPAANRDSRVSKAPIHPEKVKEIKNRKNNKIGRDDVERFLIACEITHQL